MSEHKHVWVARHPEGILCSMCDAAYSGSEIVDFVDGLEAKLAAAQERIAELEKEASGWKETVGHVNQLRDAQEAENQRLREALEGLIEVIEEEDIDVGFSNIYTKKLIANAALGRSDTEEPND